MKRAILFFITCVVFPMAFAEAQNKMKGLSIGDKVPELLFNNVINYPFKKVSSSDFIGKLIILDFWSRGCGVCLEQMPHLDSLQRKFEGKIQILLVNPHDREESTVITHLKSREKLTGYYPGLPIPLFDVYLKDFFPHQTIPHVIWINKEGKLIHVTDYTEVTEGNIQKVLNNEYYNPPIKNDFQSVNSPKANSSNSQIIYQSTISGYNRSLIKQFKIIRNENGEITGYLKINYSLKDLIYDAHPVRQSRTWFDLKSNEIINENDTSHIYCYELKVPALIGAEISKWNSIQSGYLRVDLSRAFGIYAKKDKRKLESYVLTANPETFKYYTRYSKRAIAIEKEWVKKYMRNVPMQKIAALFEYHLNKPVIDETNVVGNVDLEFPDNFDLSNSEVFIQLLKSKGINVMRQERVLEVDVITDKYN